MMRTCPSCRMDLAPGTNFCPVDGARVDTGPSGSSGDLSPGTAAGEYEITEKLAEGGMGTVYAGIHPAIGKKVAVKVLHATLASNRDILERFLTEARVVNQIGHPNIVDIFAFGQLPDARHYFVMELLKGSTLTGRMAHQRPLPVPLLLHVMDAACDAIEAAHKHGIIHRDLKPDNVFLCEREGSDVSVKLLDFGIAKLLHEDRVSLSKTGTGIPIGTPHYMSPEQCRGASVDHRTDIYSLGVLLYEMTTGQVPFPEDTYVEVLHAHLAKQPRPPQELVPMSSELAEVILRAMSKDPDARLQSAAEMRARLAEVRDVVPGARRATGPLMVTRHATRSRAAARRATGPRNTVSAGPQKQRERAALVLPTLAENGEVRFSSPESFLEKHERHLRSGDLQVQSLRELTPHERIPIQVRLPSDAPPVRAWAEVVFVGPGVAGLHLELDGPAEACLAREAAMLRKRTGDPATGKAQPMVWQSQPTTDRPRTRVPSPPPVPGPPRAAAVASPDQLRRQYEAIDKLNLFERLGLHYSSHPSELHEARARVDRELDELAKVHSEVARKCRRFLDEAVQVLTDPESRKRYRLELLGEERSRFVAEHLLHQARTNMSSGEMGRAARMLDVSLELHASRDAETLLATLRQSS